ncbi:hypothetical protein Poly24_26430 [Rosistilla carotiformis]|uniref:TIGR03067 domain-containing protein n=1 Tax=Rosistilla carotiformis TaxID=2528017 RepID=A0A518JTQ6_9BACT|nr:TIGR03067 domain-containing protein [Rosistilla carotiformis]QDV68930.1 hypothetical protein Poly24_26430 [Rosistilla carotiformis]
MNARTITALTTTSMLLCLASLAAAGERAPGPTPHDTSTEKFQGRWKVVAGVNQGRELSEAEIQGTTVTVATNTIVTYDRDEHQRFRAVFTIDAAEKPMHIDMTSIPEQAPLSKEKVDRPKQDVIAAGILKFDGDDRCVLCYALPGADRPTKFASPEGSKLMLFKMERMQGDPVPDHRSKDASR